MEVHQRLFLQPQTNTEKAVWFMQPQERFSQGGKEILCIVCYNFAMTVPLSTSVTSFSVP